VVRQGFGGVRGGLAPFSKSCFWDLSPVGKNFEPRGKRETADGEQNPSEYPASGGRPPRFTGTEGTNLNIAAKIKADSRKFATAMIATTTPSGSPNALVKLPASPVTAVESRSETSSRNAPASTRLKEKSLPRITDQMPPAPGGASHILSRAAWSERTKAVAAKSRTAIPTSPAHPSCLLLLLSRLAGKAGSHSC
jgi:hypothetical protein